MEPACSPTSPLDCRLCLSDKRVKIDGRDRCTATCTGTGTQCKRLSLNIHLFNECLQHGVMNAEQLTSAQRKALLSFIADSSLTDDRKREYGLMLRGRSLPADLRHHLRPFVLSQDDQLRRAIHASRSGFDSIEAIELLRDIYKLDPTISLLRDTVDPEDTEPDTEPDSDIPSSARVLRWKHIRLLDPTLPYYIWCTDTERTTDLIRRGHFTNVVVVSTIQGHSYCIRSYSDQGFLTDCPMLQKVHFIFPFVTHIGSHWVSKCESLKHVSFDLPNLTAVGARWLWSSKSLQSVTFAGLPRLSSVKGFWMCFCTRLTYVDFTGLRNLVSVGDNWLSFNNSMVAPRFFGLERLETIGYNWMAYCGTLATPEFRGLDSLKVVKHDWMRQCPKLTNPDTARTISFLEEVLC
jgi:hypothetical protein